MITGRVCGARWRGAHVRTTNASISFQCTKRVKTVSKACSPRTPRPSALAAAKFAQVSDRPENGTFYLRFARNGNYLASAATATSRENAIECINIYGFNGILMINFDSRENKLFKHLNSSATSARRRRVANVNKYLN